MQSEKFDFKSVVIHEVSENEVGQRIDNFLISKAKNVPKSCIYRVIRKGEVRVNKKRIKPEYKLKLGDLLRLPPIKDVKSSIAAIDSEQIFDVVYSDNEFLVINKPSGIAVHGGSGVSAGVIESLRAQNPDLKSLELAHRLDRETSGVLVCTKRRAALVRLHAALTAKTVKKRYLALLSGSWQAEKTTRVVDAPLKKNQLASGERFVKVHPEGQSAKTTFKLLQNFALACLVEVFPETGRTHQIRVHAKHMGQPIVGDEKYASRIVNQKFKQYGLNRLFLHASRLRFHQEDKVFEFSADLPKALEKVLDSLR